MLKEEGASRTKRKRRRAKEKHFVTTCNKCQRRRSRFKHTPEKVVVPPQDPVAMVKLHGVHDLGAVHVRPAETKQTFDVHLQKQMNSPRNIKYSFRLLHYY